MKNALLTFALAAAGVAVLPIVTSHAAETTDADGGFFINGNIGQSSLGNGIVKGPSNVSKGVFDGNDRSYMGNIGYRWALSPGVLFGVEGGYTYLGSFNAKVDKKNDLFGGRLPDLKGWNAGVNTHINLDSNWYLSGRTGLFRGDIKGNYYTALLPNYNLPNRIDAVSHNYYAGVGGGYDFNNHFSIGINYDYYKLSGSHKEKIDKKDVVIQKFDFAPHVISVSAEYRF